MSIRDFSPNIGIQSRPKISFQNNRHRSIRTHSEKKFTPKINKSFTCYNEVVNSNGTEKSRYVSFMNLKLRPKSIVKSRRLRASPKFSSSPVKKEASLALVEKAENLIKAKQFEEALEILNKIISEDPSLPPALLIRGKCLMETKKYNEAIADLLVLTRSCPTYDKNAFLALAMNYVAVGDLGSAVRKLNKALSLYPRFKEALLTRGQLLNQQKLWEKAANDFYKVIQMAPEDVYAYIGISESFIGLNNLENALQALKSAKHSIGTVSIIMIKKAKILLELNQLEKSIKVLNKTIKIFPYEAECYYLKAVAFIKSENLTEAALCLEQVVKFDSEKKFTGHAIFDLGVIKIKQKDYYGAIHTFKRASDMQIEIPHQKIMENYVEAILLLVKRKFKEGISLLSKIIKKNHPILSEYIGNCYTFRGFAHSAQEQHEKAAKDLNKAAKLQKLDSASKYNLLISQAILYAEKKSEQSLALLQKAKKLYNKNAEPLIYEASINFMLNRPEKAASLLTAAMSLRPGDSDLHFFRGVVKYSQEKYTESIKDIEIAIDKSDDNNVFHYLCKALDLTGLGMYKEALNDFSAVLQIESNYAKAHLYRGMCAFLLEDSDLAYSEFQKLLYLQPENAEAHLYAGNLLLANNCIKDALKAYKNSLSKEKTKEALLQCAKCYILLGDFKKSQEEISELLSLDNNKLLLQDFNILKGLEFFEIKNFREAQKIFQNLPKDGCIISKAESYKFNALCYFFMGDYKNALIIFREKLLTGYSGTGDTAYNIALCQLLLQQYDQGIKQLNELAYLVNEQDRAKILLLLSYLQQSTNNEADAKALMQAAFKLDNTLFAKHIENKSEIKIFPLSSENNFCNKFPTIPLKLGTAQVLVRPSFTLPFIELPLLDFQTDKSLLDRISLKHIKSRPEAPWMNRVQGMIQFTDEVQEITNETESESVIEDPEAENQSDVFDSDFENFKKYRSAYCLSANDSQNLFNQLKASIEKN